MNIKAKFFSGLILVILCTSCVSSKVYDDLEGRYNKLEKEHRKLQENTRQDKQALQDQISQLQNTLEKANLDLAETKNELEDTRHQYENLKNSYDALEKNSAAAVAENSRQNRELLANLEKKQKELSAENERLQKLQKDLKARSQRVQELESLIAAKDAKMKALKDAISKALTNFEGNGLSVEQRNGKVYVSMENKLLFSSGSWAINTEGRKAVEQLGKVLAKNPDISVLIEGHTDNVPYNGSGQLNDNWDLSAKRATSVVQLLRENATIDPQNLTAAGRGEYAPVASNHTEAGRAKNRRIEVILTPKLDEVSKLLNEEN